MNIMDTKLIFILKDKKGLYLLKSNLTFNFPYG